MPVRHWDDEPAVEIGLERPAGDERPEGHTAGGEGLTTRPATIPAEAASPRSRR